MRVLKPVQSTHFENHSSWDRFLTLFDKEQIDGGKDNEEEHVASEC